MTLNMDVSEDGPSSSQTSAPSRYIAGTPCFTEHITACPMPKGDRYVYIDHAVAAAVDFITDLQNSQTRYQTSDTESAQFNVCALTLLLPELNPSLDVYDRRFLLSLVWALVLRVAFDHRKRVRVLIQGTGSFGAIPLSIAGLRRTFEADLLVSEEGLGGHDAVSSVLRVGDLEDPASVEDEDEVFVVVSPTNATGVAVITDLMKFVSRVGTTRPVICINPRLEDVPSAAGVMGTSGRDQRIQFIRRIHNPFYLRLLYSSGTMYPLRGILYHRHRSPWQIWRHFVQDDTASYEKIADFQSHPDSSDITDAFAADAFQRQTAENTESLRAAPSDVPPLVVGILAAIVALVTYYIVSSQ